MPSPRNGSQAISSGQAQPQRSRKLVNIGVATIYDAPFLSLMFNWAWQEEQNQTGIDDLIRTLNWARRAGASHRSYIARILGQEGTSEDFLVRLAVME